MYLLWYSPERKAYSLDFANDKTSFIEGNEVDIIFEFQTDEIKTAQNVLRNLNIACLQAV